MVEKDLVAFVTRLKNDSVTCFIPDELASASRVSDVILASDWGKHTWFLDSEGSLVMLFEPIDG